LLSAASGFPYCVIRGLKIPMLHHNIIVLFLGSNTIQRHSLIISRSRISISVITSSSFIFKDTKNWIRNVAGMCWWPDSYDCKIQRLCPYSSSWIFTLDLYKIPMVPQTKKLPKNICVSWYSVVHRLCNISCKFACCD
jgi:hypothetical protein